MPLRSRDLRLLRECEAGMCLDSNGKPWIWLGKELGLQQLTQKEVDLLACRSLLKLQKWFKDNEIIMEYMYSLTTPDEPRSGLLRRLGEKLLGGLVSKASGSTI